MSHTVTGTVQTAINAGHVPFMVLVELDFSSGFVRVCNADITVTWDSKSWTGLGNLGEIAAIDEASDLSANGITLKLSGIPSSIISTALTEHYQGRDVKVWLAPVNADTNAPLADPVLVFHGRGDTMSIELGETATITYSAESRLADWDRPRVRRFNGPDQQLDYPADMGFEFVEQMVEKELRWG